MRMEWAGSISWTVVVWVRIPQGRVRGEAVMVVQLAVAVEDVLIRRWDVVTKIGGELVTGDGLERGKAGMVDPIESSSMVSRGCVIRLVENTVECFENTMVGGVVVYLVVSQKGT